MDKRAVEDFIAAYVWFSSNTKKIKAELDRREPGVVAVYNWFLKASANPTSFSMTNGFVVSAMVMRRIYSWDPIDPEQEKKIRPAIEQMFPDIYPKTKG